MEETFYALREATTSIIIPNCLFRKGFFETLLWLVERGRGGGAGVEENNARSEWLKSGERQTLTTCKLTAETNIKFCTLLTPKTSKNSLAVTC
jgi:hypothetical protein